MDMGDLLPTYQPSYWLGLVSSAAAWPAFDWLDDSPAPVASAYQHWGLEMPSESLEPNSNASCAVGNYSQSADSPPAFGWSDADCALRLPFMCRKLPRGAFVYISESSNVSTANGAGSFEVATPGGLLGVGSVKAGSAVITPGGTTAAPAKRPPPSKAAVTARASLVGDEEGSGLVTTYTSGSGRTYVLNTTAATFMAAEAACNNQGGHLVSYESLAEQVRCVQDLALVSPQCRVVGTVQACLRPSELGAHCTVECRSESIG
jgi:hypothetical protein